MVTTWRPLELTFETDGPSEPHGADRPTVSFRHPSGETYDVPAFPDGEGTFRVRFAPPRSGEWTWRADSADPALRDDGSFEATDGESDHALHEHGHLRADERILRHADGTPFFWLGDTVWSASSRATPEEWAEYLDRRAEQGYNVIQMNALPQHDATKPHDRLPFGEEWDLDAPDPAYFRALDELVATAHERGFVPALVALWFDYVPDTNADWDYVYDERRPMTAEQARAFGRYLGARYGAYGAVWLVSGDSDFSETSLRVYRAAAEGIRESCTNPVRTAHQPGGQTTPEALNDEDWLDFHTYQSGHSRDLGRPARLAREHRALDPPRPVLNGEPCYEDMYNQRPEDRFGREIVRAAGWLSVLGGATVGITYGALGLWSWHREGGTFEAGERWGEPDPWREALAYESGEDYARLRRILSGFDAATLEPRDLLESDRPEEVAAVASDAVFVYLADGRDVSLGDVPAVETFEWIDPATGETAAASAREGDDGVDVAAPEFEGDALLVGRQDP